MKKAVYLGIFLLVFILLVSVVGWGDGIILPTIQSRAG